MGQTLLKKALGQVDEEKFRIFKCSLMCCKLQKVHKKIFCGIFADVKILGNLLPIWGNAIERFLSFVVLIKVSNKKNSYVPWICLKRAMELRLNLWVKNWQHYVLTLATEKCAGWWIMRG